MGTFASMHRIEEWLSALTPRWALMLVAVLTLLACLPGFVSLPPVDRDEARFAVSSRQMLATGNLIDIRFQDGTRYKKPVGIYWLQAAAVAATGPSADAPIWRYRLPSLLAAVLSAVLVARLGHLIGGARVGLLAGIAMAGVFVLGGEARLAKTDAVLLATVLAGQLLLAILWVRSREGRAPGPHLTRPQAAVFWAALGVGVLVKGPIGLAFVALTAVVLSLRARGARWLAGLRPLSGLAIVAIIVLPWYIAISLTAGRAFWDESLGRDLLGKVATGQESHGAPPGFYVATLWLSFFPAAVALALALPAIWRHRALPGVVFGLAWFVPGWLMYELVTTKLLHYTLPALPGLALAMALVWDQTVRAPRAVWAVALAALAALVPFAVLAGIAFAARDLGPVPWVPLATGAAVVAAGTALFAVSLRRGCGMVAMLSLWLAGAGLQGGLVTALVAVGSLWPAPALVQIARQGTGCADPTLRTVDYAEASLVFLTAGRMSRQTSAAAAADARRDSCSVAVLPQSEPAPPGLRRIGSFAGMNIGSGREIDLAVYAR